MNWSGPAILALAVVAGCHREPAITPAVATPRPVVATLEVVEEKLHGRALEANLLGDSPDRIVTIVLPPSYRTAPDRRYPVLYLLHGIGGSNADWTGDGYQGITIQAALAAAIAAGGPEMIVVAPNAYTRYLGSFYVDSSTNGGWETFLVDELVASIDARYRTRASADGRGIAGHSMGGYGALVLAMHHPDVFGAAYAMAPCCVAWVGDLAAGNTQSWQRAVAASSFAEVMAHAKAGNLMTLAFLSIAAAWSPSSTPPLFVAWPFTSTAAGLVAAEPAHAQWTEAFPLGFLERHVDDVRRLRGIAIDAATQDQFSHIPEGVRLFSAALRRHGIAHDVDFYDGDHSNRIGARLSSHVLPFFARTLRAER